MNLSYHTDLLFHINLPLHIGFYFVIFTYFLIYIVSFAISNFTEDFVNTTNQEDIYVNSQYILESLSSLDPEFMYGITYD